MAFENELAEIDAVGPASADGRARLIALTRTGAGGTNVLARLAQALAAPLTRTSETIELLLSAAQQSWIADQRDPAATRARDYARHLIELVPDLPDGYRLLGFAHLSRGEYMDAYLALSAVKTVRSAANFDNFRALARNLMTEVNPVSFDLGGQRYTFHLTAHNAAAIESSAFHSIGLLTEWDELQYLAATMRPERIAEVGVLVGNHSAFFLKTFAPTHLTLIDADPANLPFIRTAASFNLPDGPQPEITLHCAFIGADSRDAVTFAGAEVPMRPLNVLVPGPVDFLKIDVDGGELGLLDGAAEVIELYRPTVMIETTPTTHAPVLAWFAARGYHERRTFDHGGYRNVVVSV